MDLPKESRRKSPDQTFISIFNDVLGPVMRGQSSSHTAGSFYIGQLIRELFGEIPSEALFTFDPSGSYARVYQAQGADLGFASGLLGWTITDERYGQALETAKKQNLCLRFSVSPFPEADHPNSVRIELRSKEGKEWSAVAKSTGGGRVKIVRMQDWDVDIDGRTFKVLVHCRESQVHDLHTLLEPLSFKIDIQKRNQEVLLNATLKSRPDPDLQIKIESLISSIEVWFSSPRVFPKMGEPTFLSAEEIGRITEETNFSLGKIALQYESTLLGISEEACLEEMKKRLRIMEEAIKAGFQDRQVNMQLLEPSAFKVNQAIEGNAVSLGGPHAKAAARALAVMHTANSMGIVCAAPTGGSAGVLPGVIFTLLEEKKLKKTQGAMALFAAGAIGLILARRATFAAEMAGCQVEIGAAGAMGAAAAVDAVGGGANLARTAAGSVGADAS